ncbi:3-methylcrotonyl-CoA carboxylase subunit alpha [Rhizodiscina lignyota]|uniref:3-methylcrotonyl-CoA carboxylase subunit alpha n=1 Tax=Rhizodiscina lignyota TaxID=1504668 RepID=A0A9P4INQ3_9PEZI|nr:3-methylcrotonyl-CoA carboxylase subunit alpha [Rhizodiscina lignyota]
MRAAQRIPLTSSIGRAALARRWHSTSSPSDIKPLTSILIANRGEIALRVGRTASEYGIRTTTIYTNPDAHSQHALSSPFAVNLGAPSAYLDGDRIIDVARAQGCQGIHPGYGFLSENPGFARKCTEAGLTFIGPPWQAIETMGSKSRSKEIMTAAGVPCIPGYHGAEQAVDVLEKEAKKIGYPVLLKAVKGGGGKGMRIVTSPDEFRSQLESAKSEARNSFGDDVMLVEKYITTPRHIEVQVFADKYGNSVALGERDCSVQRRHQKILEESPAPNLDDAVRKDLWEKARQAALAVGYEGAGTVEFIFDNETGEFFFMEMNTRLQVEHPVTEMVTGEDLVRWQFIVAEGGRLPLNQEEVEQRIKERGHAVEARIYAEDPNMNFMPSTGVLQHLRTPEPTSTVRIDAGFVAGDEVSSHYDPMIAKLIVQGPTRTAALQKMRAALEQYEVAGPTTNIEFLKRVCVSPAFVAGEVETGYIQKYHDELFKHEEVPDEAWAQAAIGMLLEESSRQEATLLQPIGFGTSFQHRVFELAEIAPQGDEAPSIPVSVTQLGPDRFSATVGSTIYDSVTSTYDRTSSTLTTFFPHTRIATTLVRSSSPDNLTPILTLFQRGTSYKLRLAAPKWLEAALGKKDVANSVLAPMPCKVLRVEVKEGDEVIKDQPLVVVESMKMEMVVRSPGEGKVKRVVHGVGDICAMGTALVEFEDEGKSE